MKGKNFKVLIALATIALLIGCQSTVSKIGQDHANEVIKWQELARYAGNELNSFGLTITAGIQINNNPQNPYSIKNVQLSKSSSQVEIDLLSPEFAEKLACSDQCQKLNVYDPNYDNQQTQLARFFSEKEGEFFEFYGRLTRLNEVISDFKDTSSTVVDKYLNLILNRNVKFSSLNELVTYLETEINQNKLIAYSKSGFISPSEDRLETEFSQDLIASFPESVRQNDVAGKDMELSQENIVMPEDTWDVETSTPDEMLVQSLLNASQVSLDTTSWDKHKQYPLTIGSIVCSYSDNSFGIVKSLGTNNALIKLVAQARVIIDGMKFHAPSGYLFRPLEVFDFVKDVREETYPLSDIAACNTKLIRQSRNTL